MVNYQLCHYFLAERVCLELFLCNIFSLQADLINCEDSFSKPFNPPSVKNLTFHLRGCQRVIN